MPGIPPINMRSPASRDAEERKNILDAELIAIIAPQVFVLRRALSLRVVQRRFFEHMRYYIPFEEFGYADLVSYLHTVKGIRVVRNATNGQYEVVADEEDEVFNITHFFFPNQDGNGNV